MTKKTHSIEVPDDSEADAIPTRNAPRPRVNGKFVSARGKAKAPAAKKPTSGGAPAPKSAPARSKPSLDLSEWDDFKREPGAHEKDQFYVPKHLVPDGFSVEWKRHTILDAPDKAEYQVTLQRAGWRPAPAHLFAELLPEGYTSDVIIRGGLMLMIRPSRLTEEARNENRRRADNAVTDKMREMTEVTNSAIPRQNFGISRTHESGNTAIPD